MIMTGHHLPAHLGPYRAIELVAEGGMGRVYRAWKGSSRTGRAWALKVAIDDDQATEARLEREAALGPRLRHRNLVGVHETVRHGDQLVLVLPFVEGVTLQRFVHRVSMGDHTSLIAAHVAVETLRGLAHAHAHGVIHRDISPENILVGFDGAIRIADFGIAGEWRDVPLPTRIGKPRYVAPEQREGRADKRSDLYSLGVVLCELCGARIDDTGPPAVPAGLPGDLATLLGQMIRFDPRDRTQTAAAALDAAQRILARLGGPGRCVHAMRDAMAIVAPGRAAGDRLTDVVSTAYRRVGWVLAVGAIVLLGLSVTLALAGSEDRRGDGAYVPSPPSDSGIAGESPGLVTTPPRPEECTTIESCKASCEGSKHRRAFDCTRWADQLRQQAPPDARSGRKQRRTALDIYASACEAGDPLACTRRALLAGMTAEPDLRAELTEDALRPAARLRAACRARTPRSALACAVLLLRDPGRILPEADSLCEWANSQLGDHEQCAAAIVEAACRQKVPEACVVLALDKHEQRQQAGREQLKTMSELAALYYRAALEKDTTGLLNACNLGEAVACASLDGSLGSEACALGDCSTTKDTRKLDTTCAQEVRSACAHLLFWRVSRQFDPKKVEERAAMSDPKAAVRGAAMRDQLPGAARRYAMSCYLGVADGCKKTASILPNRASGPRSNLNEAARLMSWRLPQGSRPLPDL